MTLWATEYLKLANVGLVRQPDMHAMATGIGHHGLDAAMNSASKLQLPAKQPMPGVTPAKTAAFFATAYFASIG